VSKKYEFNTRWDKDILICACLQDNPCCDRYKTCEVLELTFNPYDGVKDCMGQRKYKRNKRGAIEQR
jgi:hypothetical protein